MNDNNNFPNNNNKLPEGWGNSNNGDTKASPWGNKPQTIAWENSPKTSAWENTNNNPENRSSKPKGVNTENVNAAINKFAGMAKRAGEKAVSTAADAAKNAADYAKSDEAAEKMNAVKNKAQAFASGAGSKLSDIKSKASDKISEHKNKGKASDENISAADEYNAADNCDVSSDETVYQNDEKYAPHSIADAETDKNEPPLTKIDNTVQYQQTTSAPRQNNNTNFPDNALNRNYQQPQIPVPPPSSAPSYVVQTQKTNPVLIIIIIVLVLIVGILGGIFFIKNNNEKNNNNGTNVMYDASTETTSAAEGTITPSSDTSPENETQHKTEIASQQEAIPSEEQIMQAVQKAMYAHLDAELNKEKTDDFYHFDRDVKYALYDINSDGIDELFISYQNIESTGSDLYIYKNGEYIKFHDFGTGAEICLTEQLLRENVYGGGEMTKIYVISDNEILQKDELKLLYGYGTTFYHNDFVISESEYNQLKSTYDSMNWIYVPDNSRAFSDMIDMSNYSNTSSDSDVNTSKYKKLYEGCMNIENAPADMEFYDVNKTTIGYVNTESTSLNMRAGAGKNYNVVIEIPKGAEVEIFGENSEWYYAKYIKNMKPTPTAYFGFVNKQYISFTPTNTSVEVYSCNYLGQISAPSGGPINGYATSYIVDRGAVSYTRTDLMDNWHVTAVSYCVVNDITWYELYDTDDGDYYGWLDEDHIDFY